MTLAADQSATLPDEERQLIERARGGDGEAFGELVTRHWDGLTRLARVILVGRPESEDVVQDALLVAWRRLPSLRRPASFGAWLRRIVQRACLRHLSRSPHASSLVAEPAVAGGAGAELEVEQLLRLLSPRQRAAFYLTAAEGYSAAEAGAALGMAAATVRVHCFKARRTLRRALGGEE